MTAAHQWQIFCHNAEQRQSKAKRKESGTIRVLFLLVINYFQPTLFYIRDEIKVLRLITVISVIVVIN